MTGTTIAGNYLFGITLSDPALQDPATITDMGSINVTATSGSPSSRIGVIFDPTPVVDQRVIRKGLHYRG